jgi:hypothetical protein
MTQAIEEARSFLHNVLHAEEVDRVGRGTDDFSESEAAWVSAFREGSCD